MKEHVSRSVDPGLASRIRATDVLADFRFSQASRVRDEVKGKTAVGAEFQRARIPVMGGDYLNAKVKGNHGGRRNGDHGGRNGKRPDWLTVLTPPYSPNDGE